MVGALDLSCFAIRPLTGAASARSVSAAQLAVIPARNLLRRDLEDHALRSARSCTGRDSRIGRRLAYRPHRLAHRLRIIDYFTGTANHHAAILRIALAYLDHDANLRVAPCVEHLLRLAVG